MNIINTVVLQRRNYTYDKNNRYFPKIKSIIMANKAYRKICLQ